MITIVSTKVQRKGEREGEKKTVGFKGGPPPPEAVVEVEVEVKRGSKVETVSRTF
jgi:hypothetical protein